MGGTSGGASYCSAATLATFLPHTTCPLITAHPFSASRLRAPTVPAPTLQAQRAAVLPPFPHAPATYAAPATPWRRRSAPAGRCCHCRPSLPCTLAVWSVCVRLHFSSMQQYSRQYRVLALQKAVSLQASSCGRMHGATRTPCGSLAGPLSFYQSSARHARPRTPFTAFALSLPCTHLHCLSQHRCRLSRPCHCLAQWPAAAFAASQRLFHARLTPPPTASLSAILTAPLNASSSSSPPCRHTIALCSPPTASRTGNLGNPHHFTLHSHLRAPFPRHSPATGGHCQQWVATTTTRQCAPPHCPARPPPPWRRRRPWRRCRPCHPRPLSPLPQRPKTLKRPHCLVRKCPCFS